MGSQDISIRSFDELANELFAVLDQAEDVLGGRSQRGEACELPISEEFVD